MSFVRNKTISGIKWSTVASAVQRIISFGTTIVLARILTPADFGLVALAFVVVNGCDMFKSLGFDSAIIRCQEKDMPKACDTAFIIITATGIVLFIVLFIGAPLCARFLNDFQVVNIIRGLGFLLIIGAIGEVPQAIISRDMKFKCKSIGKISAMIAYSVVALFLALNKFGVWSLVAAYIAKRVVQIIVEWYFSGWRPKFEFGIALAKNMFHFGKYILGSQIIWFLFTSSDNVIVGKVLGMTMLGYYTISWYLANYLSENLFGNVSIIMYPAYSKIQEAEGDIKSAMLKTLSYVSGIIFPFSFGLFLFVPEILRFGFGAKWLPATNILRILVFVGLIRSLRVTIWPIFLAKGKSKLDFKISIIHAVLFIIFAIPLVFKFQLIGVGIAVLLANLIGFYIGLKKLRQIIFADFFEVLKPLAPALISSAIMLIGGLFLKSFLLNKTQSVQDISVFGPGWMYFLIAAFGTGFIYLVAAYFIIGLRISKIREILFT